MKRIGVMSPGDMGQAVAQQLKGAGFEVLGALSGRSQRTQALGKAAGLRDVGGLEQLIAECDVILSIMDPGSATGFVHQVIAAARGAAKRPVLIDCNALAPSTKIGLHQSCESAGLRFIDGGIIGAPPRGEAKTRLYVSGAGAEEFLALATPQLIVRVAGPKVGDASAVKMCFAALGKGAQAMVTEIMVAAHKLGVVDALMVEYAGKAGEVYRFATGELPKTPPKAYRWVPEMREIAKTFADLGLPPDFYEGAARMYEMMAETPVAKESPEKAREKARSGDEVLRLIATREAV